MNLPLVLLAGVVGIFSVRFGVFSQEAGGPAEAPKSSQTAPRSGEPDAKGVPRDLVVVNPAGYGLDEQAVKAVSQYRFKPALREGVAVPVYLSVGVSFRIY